MEPKTSHLTVPGASLYYEVRGAGPVLLLICGGIYDAIGYAPLADALADRYTVVTYDRRGNSRSTLEGPREYQSIAVHADDAHRVLAAVGVSGDERAYVFGNSSGAIIGLELAARHREQVHTLVAHEPPIFDLLPNRDYWRTVIQDVVEKFATAGAGPAIEALNAGFGAEPVEDGAPRPEPQSLDPELAARVDAHLAQMEQAIQQNLEFFIGYEVPPFAEFVPDLESLRSSAARVLAGVGEASVGEPPYRAAVALAEKLGSQPVVFPGDHGGFAVQYDTFAAVLHQVLSST
ncbi:MAG TPA: alpha/beta hydrolase [Kribbella sp.]|nr:alpha/beta hydrolase [Kribbella sp.]